MMRILMPSAAACAAAVMVSTLGISTSLPAHAAPVTAEIDEHSLMSIDESGIDAPGARAASGETAGVANQSMVNLPSIFRSAASLDQVSGAAAGPYAPGSAFAASNLSLADSAPSPAPSGDATAPSGDATSPAPTESADSGEVTGSVKDKTEDGITIAAMSDVLSVPQGNPSVVGVSFTGETAVRFEVREKTDGAWGPWQELELEASGEGRPGSDPFVVNGAQDVQVRALGEGGAPAETNLFLIDPKHSAADAQAVAENAPVAPLPTADEPEAPSDASETAAAAAEGGAIEAANASYVPGTASVETTSMTKVPQPKIGTRKSWGANEKLRRGKASYAPKIRAAVIHHTAGTNSYSADEVPSILRGIYSFHTKGRGWSDVGYNILADKYGRLWEGRAGGLDKAVIGAHVANYNSGTFGISVMGSYEKSAPPQETIDAVSQAIAWKLSKDGVSAKSKATVNGRTISAISAHRDIGQTACPGAAFYKKMGAIRDDVERMQKGGKPSTEPKETPKPSESPKSAIDKHYEGNVEQLGKPVDRERSIADGRGRQYEKGWILDGRKTDPVIVVGPIAEKIDASILTTIGFPKAVQAGGLKDGGVYQTFEKGAFHWTKATGAQPTWGVLSDYWKSKGYERGHLGYPTAAPKCADGRCEQPFQGARLVWANGYGTTEFSANGSIAGGARDLNDPADDGEGPADPIPGDDPTVTPTEAPTAEPTATPTEAPSAEPTETPAPAPTTASPEPKPTPTKTEKPKEPTPEEKEAAKRDAIIATAKEYLGVRYRWGGTSPKTGWDCSGYVQYVYGKNGIRLPRTSGAQKAAGEVISAKDAKPGDLIWVPGHIGIVSETKGMMYDAGSSRSNTSKRSYDWMVKRGAVFVRVL